MPLEVVLLGVVLLAPDDVVLPVLEAPLWSVVVALLGDPLWLVPMLEPLWSAALPVLVAPEAPAAVPCW